MSGSIDLREVERGVFRDSLQDGLLEIVIGALLYVCGLLIADPKVMLIFVVYLVFAARGLEAFKERYTYPRLGRVVLRHGKPKPLVTAAALYAVGAGALLAAGLVLSGWLRASEWHRLLPVWLGLCLGGVFWYIHRRSGGRAYVVYALVALAGGVVVASIQLPALKDYLAVYMICTGALSAVTGGVKLSRFVRSHPIVGGEVRDDNANG